MKLFFEFLVSVFVMGLIGMALGFGYALIFKEKLQGGLKAGMIVGTLGCMLGGFIFNLFFDMPFMAWLNDVAYINILFVNKFDINFVAAFLGTWMFLHVYRKISH